MLGALRIYEKGVSQMVQIKVNTFGLHLLVNETILLGGIKG